MWYFKSAKAIILVNSEQKLKLNNTAALKFNLSFLYIEIWQVKTHLVRFDTRLNESVEKVLLFGWTIYFFY